MNTQPRHPKCRALPVEPHPDIQFLPLYHGGGENQRFFCLWSFLWSKTLLCRFRQPMEIPQTQVLQGFAAFFPVPSRIQPRHSQIKRDTSFATPGYLVLWGVNLYMGRCVRETPLARQRHGALTVQTGFVRGGVGETTLILPCSAGKSNRVQADFLPAPCFA